MKKRHWLLAGFALCIVFAFVILLIIDYNSPESIASDSDGCIRFFGLSKVDYDCADEMHSQGNDCFAFGSNYYCLNGMNVESFNSLKQELIEKGASETDSIVTLIMIRSGIEGQFRLFMSNQDTPFQAIVSFKETE